MIGKVKGGYVIKHCSGGTGRVAATKKPVSLRKARSIHKAIQASKSRRRGK